MSNITIPNLPPATAMTGPEMLMAVQGGTSVSCTAQQIAALGNGAGQYLAYASPGGTSNNVNPTGFSTIQSTATGRLGVTLAGGSAVWTGLTSGYDGQRLTITNLDASNSLTLNIQSASSVASNRFLGAAGTRILAAGVSVSMCYYGTAGLWVLL